MATHKGDESSLTEQPPPQQQAPPPQDKQAQQPSPKADDVDPDFANMYRKPRPPHS